MRFQKERVYIIDSVFRKLRNRRRMKKVLFITIHFILLLNLIYLNLL